MAVHYLKKATRIPESDDPAIRERVTDLLRQIETGGEQVVRRLALEFDGWDGESVIGRNHIEQARRSLPATIKDDIIFASDRVRDFARSQRGSMGEFEVELIDGLIAGQRLIPVDTVGCYVPGGRYAHVISALMSICTAREAGVRHVIAATPAHREYGINPAILYAMDIAGADAILALGGVQAIGALAFGLFTGRPADMVVGPGNRYVAEAKRLLFGRIGIDVIAGPTESMIIADETADPELVAFDLVGQAEHGPDSPVWLVSLSRALGSAVLARMAAVIDALPTPAREAAGAAWRDYGEVLLVDDREQACQLADRYAPEHLQVQAADAGWWLGRLRNYGSLFLGEETTVAFGDKCAGPNHILPTRRAARYSGGLNVSKFIKVVTYQRMSREANRRVAPVAARISRLEGMEGHARTADIRLEKYFPGEAFELARR